jgi:hypothetical protein
MIILICHLEKLIGSIYNFYLLRKALLVVKGVEIQQNTVLILVDLFLSKCRKP